MENTVKRTRSGWREEEAQRLLSAVKAADSTSAPLRSVFEDLSQDLGRKPNSIRNYYYARLRQQEGGVLQRAAPFAVFTPEETRELLRQVLMARAQGSSVRSCVMRMAHGDHRAMLRYQNKYRTIMKHRPELAAQVMEELRQEGLPCPAFPADPADPAFCDPEDVSATRLMGEKCVSDMLEGIKELLRRAARAQKSEDQQRALDRMQVQHDLQRLAWEKDFSEATTHLETLMGILREYLALPRASQIPQLDTFCDAVLAEMTQAEEFLSRTT